MDSASSQQAWFCFSELLLVSGALLFTPLLCFVHVCALLAAAVFVFVFVLNKFIYFIYLYLAALGLRCCVQAFSSCGERGLLFFAVHGLLIAVASLVAEHGL